MSKETGGPAFPQYTLVAEGVFCEGGMTLRDYFAANALSPLMGRSGGYWAEENLAAYAKTAYVMADAMLKAREQ